MGKDTDNKYTNREKTITKYRGGNKKGVDMRN